METLKEYKKELITGIAIGFLLYFFLKYMFPLISPFFLAFVTIYSIYPLLYRTQERWKIGKTITTIVLLVLAFSIFACLLWLCIYFGEENLRTISDSLEQMRENLNTGIVTVGEWLEQKTGSSADAFEAMAKKGINDCFYSWKQMGTSQLMKNSVCCVQRVLPFLAFIGTYLKAQFIILLVIALICCIGLKLLGISYGILLGILAGILDALPFIGTGIVLIPVALLQFIQGKLWQAVIVFLIYLLCMGAREVLEPRLMGRRLGIYPVILLLSIYAGVKLFGISGIIKGPFGIVLFKQLFMRIFAVKS